MNEAVINFYNDFADRLIFQREINHARYRFIAKMARRWLKPHQTVLDLGCGIGTTSVILAAYCQDVVAVDIAPKLLDLAEPRLNITYHWGDMTELHFDRTFDVICLFDVLEHIETERVPAVFRAITRHMADTSQVWLIIPYWKYLAYKKTHHPEVIQIIDNCLTLGDLNRWARQHRLEIMHYETLSLFNICDYAYVRMRPDLTYELQRALDFQK